MKTQTLTRSYFDRLSPAAKMAHIKQGGRLTDQAAPEENPRLAILTRSQFSNLSAKDRSDYLRFGGLLRDDGVPALTRRPTPKPTQPDASRFDPEND